ncbi:MAG: alpha/beta hydrolase family protein [Bacteroidota bacterium]
MRFFHLIWVVAIFIFGCKEVPSTSDTQVSRADIIQKYQNLPASSDDLLIYDEKMDKDIPCFFVKPGSYDADSTLRFPVVYLLHGAFGNHTSWADYAPLEEMANKYQVIFVCPDGESTSWYLDSPVDPKMRYESFMAYTLPAFVDTHYRTLSNRANRAICGLSMGGHGAFFLAMRHPDLWSAAASISGGHNLLPFPNSWDLPKRLGKKSTHKQNWETHSVVNQLEAYQARKSMVKFQFDCGKDDFFFPVNEELHERMLDMKIPHSYLIKEGEHNWNYFSKALPDHLDFFACHFEPVDCH